MSIIKLIEQRNMAFSLPDFNLINFYLLSMLEAKAFTVTHASVDVLKHSRQRVAYPKINPLTSASGLSKINPVPCLVEVVVGLILHLFKRKRNEPMNRNIIKNKNLNFSVLHIG